MIPLLLGRGFMTLKLHLINWYRLYLKVFLISDLLGAKRENILDQAWTCSGPMDCHPDVHWPLLPVPPTAAI